MTRSLGVAPPIVGRRATSVAPPPTRIGRAASLLALQRRAGNAAVGALLRRGPHEGKGLRAEPDLTEELEGKAARRSLQRLTVKQHSFHQGTCGERNVQWVFSLDNPAPADGYIVQHITASELMGTCPNPVQGPAAPTQEFWEAWFVRRGAKVDWTTTRDAWTDGSVRPARPGSVGMQVSDGTLKFFPKSKTGDLGDFGVAPADPASAWGPGKVPTSGALPSTPTKPSWWDDTPGEGPVVRFAESRWNCCGADASKHTSTVTATA